MPRRFLLAAACILLSSPVFTAETKEGEVLFYRMLESRTNAPILPKTRTVCSQRGSTWTGTTGMADSGFTEYPFKSGRVDYTFAEKNAYFPRIASGVPIVAGETNVGDIRIDHVYAPDGCVWGPSGRTLHQTFTATGTELVRMSLLVASDPGVFRAQLVEGGPGGAPIGSVKTFYSGHSMEWGNVSWNAGEAPLTPGNVYAIRIWREDGAPWTPYLHSTGNCYDGGCLIVDGVARPESDLAAWIVEEPKDLTRAIVEGVDESGWRYNVTATTFTARSRNIRLISVMLSPVAERVSDIVARVWTTDPDLRLVAGPVRCLAAGPSDGAREAHFLFGSDAIPAEPGQSFRVEFFSVAHQAPMPPPDEIGIQPHDVRLRVYGETNPGAAPAIGNLKAHFQEQTTLKLRWVTSYPCKVRVWIVRVGSSDRETFVVDEDSNALDIPKLWPGHDYDFQLTAHGRDGATWQTPIYRMRVPGGPFGPPPPYPYPEQPDEFVQLAPSLATQAPEWGPIRCLGQVAVKNPGFEDGLKGWTASPDVTATGGTHDIWPPIDKHMAGWTQLDGKGEQVFASSTLCQRIPTKPGHVYLLSVRAHTSLEGGPRGDVRVRLFADPLGGETFEWKNSSQWYWTDGEWMRFQHQWKAEADHSTIGLGFFRWRDLPRASAYVDHVRVYDLGPQPRQMDDPPAAGRGIPTLMLADRKVEADERTEARLHAPPGYVITGIGARGAGDNVTTLRIRVQPLLADGTLGKPEELYGGWEADAGLEANIDLPKGFVATGFGARIAPEWDVKTLAVWGRPLLPNGTLGDEIELRAGVEPKGGLEKTVRLEPGRVLISAGLRCSSNDVAGISGESARIAPTATGRGALGE